MQQVHRALLEQAAGTWPLIFEKGVRRIQTCDRDLNGKTFSEVIELRDSPSGRDLHHIAALFDDVEMAKRLQIMYPEWEKWLVPDDSGKSVVEVLFDRADRDTQIVWSILHRKVELSPTLLALPIRVHTVGRILSCRDDDEIRERISLVGIDVQCVDSLAGLDLQPRSVQWLLDKCVSVESFGIGQLWDTTSFEGVAQTMHDVDLCEFVDHGLDVVLEVANRFPNWDSSGLLAHFILRDDYVAVDRLWSRHWRELPQYSGFFELSATQWILSLCNEEQISALRQRVWLCNDFAMVEYLVSKGFNPIYTGGIYNWATI